MIRQAIANWLYKAAIKTRGANVMVPMYQDKNAHYNTWNTDKAVREGYKASAWVYACVRKKADQTASVPLVVWKKIGKRKVEWKRVPEHPLELLLQRPNPRMHGIGLSKARTTYLDLSGNNFWFLIEVGGRPVELWPLRPDRVAPIPSRVNFISGYEYNLSGNPETFDFSEIVHFTRLDPGDDFLGMGRLQAAAKIVDTLNEAKDWNKNAMENRMVPPGGFTTEQSLSDASYTRLKAEVKEMSGVKEARSALTMEAGLKWQSFAQSAVEMDWIQSMKFGVVEVCAAFGVDPIMIGFNEYSSFNNYETAKKALWEDTLIPDLEDDCGRINQDLTPRYGDEYWVEPDLSAVPALQKSFEGRVTSGRKLWEMAVPFSIINEVLELGMNNVPDADRQWVPTGMIPMDQVGVDDEEDSDPEEDDPKSIGPQSLKVFNLQTHDQKIDYWKGMDRARAGWYKLIEKRTKKRFKDEKKAILKSLGKSTEGLDEAVESFFVGQKKLWAKFLTKADIDVMTDFGNRVGEGFKGCLPAFQTKEFDVFQEGAAAWITNNVGEKVKEILETTLLLIKEEVQVGIDEGETIPQIAKRISGLYEKFEGYRSTVIARTEVLSTSNAGSFFAAQQTGLKLEHEWLATPGSRTRKTHQQADGQKKDFNKPFVVGGYKLMFPGDVTLGAAAKEIIQCRCTSTFQLKT